MEDDKIQVLNKGVDNIWDLEYLCQWNYEIGLYSLKEIEKAISKNETVDVHILFPNEFGGYTKKYIGDYSVFYDFFYKIEERNEYMKKCVKLLSNMSWWEKI